MTTPYKHRLAWSEAQAPGTQHAVLSNDAAYLRELYDTCAMQDGGHVAAQLSALNPDGTWSVVASCGGVS